MYWPLLAGFSGVCARQSNSNGVGRRSKSRNNGRMIFMRERILTLTAGVVGAGIPSRRVGIKLGLHTGRGPATSFLLLALPGERRRRRRSLLLPGAVSARLASSDPLRESRWRAPESLFRRA